MANVYESENFNITEVYLTSQEQEDGLDIVKPHRVWFCKVQRLPESQYPLITEVHIMEDELSASSTEAEFRANAPSIIAAKLSAWDAEESPAGFSSSESDVVPKSTKKFV